MDAIGDRPVPQGLSFGRAARLKQSRDFARMRRQGERMVNGCLIANWAPAAGRGGLRGSG